MRYKWAQPEYTYDCWVKGRDERAVKPAPGAGERDRTGGEGGDCEWM